jgi:hypothetical protein
MSQNQIFDTPASRDPISQAMALFAIFAITAISYVYWEKTSEPK